MKILSITVLAAMALFSCKNENDNPTDDLLFKIQCQKKIDEKTFSTLDSISKLELSEEQMAHYSLVRINSDTKAKRFDEPDADTLLQTAINYYSNCNDNYMKAKVYFQQRQQYVLLQKST